MKGAVETFMAIIMIAFMAVLSTTYIIASLNTRYAQNFHSLAISEIEASNFSETVIDSLEEKAEENGFTKLTVDKMTDLAVAEVTLDYTYSLPFLNAVLEHKIVGYAR